MPVKRGGLLEAEVNAMVMKGGWCRTWGKRIQGGPDIQSTPVNRRVPTRDSRPFLHLFPVALVR